MKRLHGFFLHLTGSLFWVLFICLPANHANARAEIYTRPTDSAPGDSTRVMENNEQLWQAPFSYQTSFFDPSGKKAESPDSLAVDLRLATEYAGFKPHPVSNADFVFLRFSIFNRRGGQKSR